MLVARSDDTLSGVPASLRTARLRLEPWNAAHLDLLARLAARPEVTRFVGDGATWDRVRSVEAHRRAMDHWEQHGWGWRAIVERDGGAQVGLAALNVLGTPVLDAAADAVEIGWWIDPARQGQGYATEAALALRDEAGLKLEVESVVARIQPGNTPSRRVAARLGLDVVGEALDASRTLFLLHRGPTAS